MSPPIDFTDPFAPGGELLFGEGFASNGSKPFEHIGDYVIFAPNFIQIEFSEAVLAQTGKTRRIFVS
jgi:hypothetical protein